MNSSSLIELHDQHTMGSLLIMLNVSEIALTFFCQKNITILIFIFVVINSLVLVNIYLREQQEKHSDRDQLQAIQDTVTVIHNKPLQTISYLLKLVQREPQISNKKLVEQLESLNQEIYSIEESLQKISRNNNYYQSDVEAKLGIKINLNHSLHEILYDVYSQVLQHDFPGFTKLRVKVRSFDSIADELLSSKQKQQMGQALALALFDLGANSQEITRLKVIGKSEDTGYSLAIKTNTYINFNSASKEYKLYLALVQKLGGKCYRKSSETEGTIYQVHFYRISK